MQFRAFGDDAEAIAQLPGVSQVERHDEQVMLKTSDADATVRELVKTGIAWRDLDVHSMSLDDIFMTLVGSGEHAENGGHQ